MISNNGCRLFLFVNERNESRSWTKISRCINNAPPSIILNTEPNNVVHASAKAFNCHHDGFYNICGGKVSALCRIMLQITAFQFQVPEGLPAFHVSSSAKLIDVGRGGTRIWFRNSSRPFPVSIWLVSQYSLHQHRQHHSLLLGNDIRHLFEMKTTKRGKMQGFESLPVKYVGPVGKFIDRGVPGYG